MVEVLVTIVSANTGTEGQSYPITRMFRFEFDTVESAEASLDTSDDVAGLVNVEMLGAISA